MSFWKLLKEEKTHCLFVVGFIIFLWIIASCLSNCLQEGRVVESENLSTWTIKIYSPYGELTKEFNVKSYSKPRIINHRSGRISLGSSDRKRYEWEIDGYPTNWLLTVEPKIEKLIGADDE